MSETITIRVPDEIMRSLAHAAKSSGRSRNAVVVGLLSEGLQDIDAQAYQRLADETSRSINEADAKDAGLWDLLDAANAELLAHEPRG